MEATAANQTDLYDWAVEHAPELLPADDVRDIPEAWAGVWEAIEAARYAARTPRPVADDPEPF